VFFSYFCAYKFFNKKIYGRNFDSSVGLADFNRFSGLYSSCFARCTSELYWHFTPSFQSKVEFSVSFLVIWGIIVLVAQLFDYIFPLWGAKKFGGSKKGIWGSTVGMMIGCFLLRGASFLDLLWEL
jgi:hypothetical protein